MKKILSINFLLLITAFFAYADSNVQEAGKLYEAGKYSEAIKLLEKGCDNNDGDSCATIGYIFITDEKLGVDNAKAIKFFEKGCNLKSASACGSLGLVYEKGIGVTSNKNRAKKYYKTTCELGVQKGCDEYNRLK